MGPSLPRALYSHQNDRILSAALPSQPRRNIAEAEGGLGWSQAVTVLVKKYLVPKKGFLPEIIHLIVFIYLLSSLSCKCL